MPLSANGFAIGITALMLFSIAIAAAIVTAVSRRNLRLAERMTQDDEELGADPRHRRKQSILNLTSAINFNRKDAELPPPTVPPKQQADVVLDSAETPAKKLPVFRTRKSLSLSKPLPSELDMRQTSPTRTSFISLPSPTRTGGISFTLTTPSHKSAPSTLGTIPSVESVLEQYEKEADIAAESAGKKTTARKSEPEDKDKELAMSSSSDDKQSKSLDMSTIKGGDLGLVEGQEDGEPGLNIVQDNSGPQELDLKET